MLDQIFQLFNGCSHTSARLERRALPKSELKLGLPGLGPILTIGQNNPVYIYRCPTCRQDLPLSQNSRWQDLYESYRPASRSTRSTAPKSTRPKSSQGYKREPIGAKLRYDIMARDNFCCVKCGATAKQARLHVDHKIAVARGGKNDPSNLQTLCERCNLGKGIRRD